MSSSFLLYQPNPEAAQIPDFFSQPYLFGQASHLLQQTDLPLHYFGLIDRASGLSVARCGLFEKEGLLFSPGAASFGTIEFADALSDRDLHDFLEFVLQTARQIPVRRIRLTNPPACYGPAFLKRLETMLEDNGFRVLAQTPTHHLPVSDAPFVSRLHSFERHKLRKSRRDGFRSEIWQTPDVGQLFAFIRAARLRKNYRMTITAVQLGHLLSRFPGETTVFAVWRDDRLAAASIGIRVSDEVLYHFQGADHADFLSYSPTVQLVESLYEYCQQQRIPVLDLGTSVSDGVTLFKKRLGAVEGKKRTFLKEL
ncbi:GNAT family N-acetyltransferase [Tellurirhabdus rosea]|uniref:GNAT family N-acetyltransferase n=1 Tax=Tellurirhabdus rosea TaxID=2674997 RepID=UPI002255A0CE|nr:GNAT family N-acetyltransferase [Tellurirhabdus rosea]